MNTFQTYDPVSYGPTITAGIYYVFLAVATLLSIATIYVLLKRSKAKPLAFGVSVIYIMIYLSIVTEGIKALNLIK